VLYKSTFASLFTDRLTAVMAVANRRLQNLLATVNPTTSSAGDLSQVACAAPAIRRQTSITEMEGKVFARAAQYKVCMFGMGESRGVPLANRPAVEETFKKSSLDVYWAFTLSELREDTNVLVTTGAPVGPDVLSKLPKLSLIAVGFTGYDHVDVDACRSHGVSVVNVPVYASDSTAELALSLVLAHLHRHQECFDTVRRGEWGNPQQEDLQSKTIGIIGTGSLGLRCAEIFNVFKVKAIIGFDRDADPAFTALGGTYTESLAALFLDADVIIVCLPLTEETRGMVSAKLLNLLNPESILINVGRGDVVDEVAMVELLKDRRFRAGLDVFSKEPLPADDPLHSVPADVLLMTPHVGYQSTGSLKKRFDATVKSILAFLVGQAINIV
jgi:D-3-phosphoglycerate dehydrogenase